MSRYNLKSINKASTEKYDFRFNPSGYAIIFLDEISGTISMKTDWGDFTYSWTKSGRGTKTLKEFLLSAHTDYLMNKFCSKSYFDLDLTKAKINEIIKNERQYGVIDNKEKLLCFVEIEDFHPTNENDLYHHFEYSCPLTYEKIFRNDLYGLPVCIDYTPCNRGFFEEVWPIILNEFSSGKSAE